MIKIFPKLINDDKQVLSSSMNFEQDKYTEKHN